MDTGDLPKTSDRSCPLDPTVETPSSVYALDMDCRFNSTKVLCLSACANKPGFFDLIPPTSGCVRNVYRSLRVIPQAPNMVAPSGTGICRTMRCGVGDPVPPRLFRLSLLRSSPRIQCLEAWRAH